MLNNSTRNRGVRKVISSCVINIPMSQILMFHFYGNPRGVSQRYISVWFGCRPSYMCFWFWPESAVIAYQAYVSNQYWKASSIYMYLSCFDTNINASSLSIFAELIAKPMNTLASTDHHGQFHQVSVQWHGIMTSFIKCMYSDIVSWLVSPCVYTRTWYHG